MANDIEVKYSGERDRYKVASIILQWCIINHVSAFFNTRQYMTQDGADGIFTTTFWNVPDEKERTFFILRWCK